MSFSFSRRDFPNDFIFGVATAAYQIEGSKFGNCGSSHWDTWSETPGNVHNSDNGSIACDHYNRFYDDLDIIKSGGFDSYRFSTSWSRVMPDGKSVNSEGLDFYDRLVDGMISRGLKPNLTLYHWELPSYLADIGGWTNRDIAERFAEFTDVIINRIGDRIDHTATINEPWCVAWLSYFLGGQAPGIRDIRAAVRAMHHVMLAHGKALEVLKSHGQSNLGIVLNLGHGEPASNTQADINATKTFDAIHTRWFMDSLFKGNYPKDMLSKVEKYMPENFESDMKLISSPIDWLGVNYYTRGVIKAVPNEPWPHFEGEEGVLPKTQMGWEIYPEGLELLLKRIYNDYTNEIPIMITENGMANEDVVSNDICDDPIRVKYFEDHLQAVIRCIAYGVPVKGFFGWSLLDNYEWAYGYEKRFGLVHVDYKTQKRTPKASFKAFQKAISGNQ
ncbi:GH1 family beta-glucosidase [Amylibacter sp.]|nr:GH1 family beta-glucosidase [Amylibacter sp.]